MSIRALMLVVSGTTAVSALEPAEIAVVANKSMPDSVETARHYLKARNIPAGNLIELDLPKDEDISRSDYSAKLVKPLREHLRDRKQSIRCILCMYGVPLRVGRSTPSAEDKDALKKLEPIYQERLMEQKQLAARIMELQGKGKAPDPESAAKLAEMQKKFREIEALVRSDEARRKFLSHAESEAAVDSELMLLWWDGYETRRWQVNSLNFRISPLMRENRPPVLLACRLDGPGPQVVRRMIDDSVAVEKTGLVGKAYIDARNVRYDPKSRDLGTGYAGYDESMRETAALFHKARRDFVLDDRPDVFPPNSCPDCAIYTGWYSHARFVDSSQFARGAVAWHLASSEAVSLRRPGATYWCKNLLEKGACATLGPVAEPYTIGFPKPAEFFGYLMTGKYTLAECYGKTVLFSSWMGTLVGDPLYNPFQKNPIVAEGDITPSPLGAKPVFSTDP